jgi:hypothetical protein
VGVISGWRLPRPPLAAAIISMFSLLPAGPPLRPSLLALHCLMSTIVNADLRALLMAMIATRAQPAKTLSVALAGDTSRTLGTTMAQRVSLMMKVNKYTHAHEQTTRGAMLACESVSRPRLGERTHLLWRSTILTPDLTLFSLLKNKSRRCKAHPLFCQSRAPGSRWRATQKRSSRFSQQLMSQ